MTNLCKWGTTSLQTLMSSELNSLAISTFSPLSAAFDNTSTLYAYADFEVFLNFASGTPAATAFVSIQILEAIDGTNFPGTSTSQLDTGGAMQQGVYMIPIGQASATAQRAVVRQVALPPAQFKTILWNQTGLQFPATGNTVKALMYGYNFNG